MRFPPLHILFVIFALACAPASAVCTGSGARCSASSACCPGYLCAPAGTCQPGCLIDSVFVRSGTRNPANPCQSCQPSRSTVAWTGLANGTTCSDGNPCTGADTCRSGACVGGAATSCNDYKRCTVDACDPVLGCVHSPVVCDDGNGCTIDSCNISTGLCQFRSSPTTICDDRNVCTTDTCDPATGCAHAPRAGTCTDANVCTIADRCDAGVCVGGIARDCDDHNPSTVDSCDPLRSCLHEVPSVPASPPAAFLFFPDVVATNAPDPRVETSLKIQNAGNASIIAHVSFVNGDPNDPRYCYECDFDVPMRGRETQTLLVTRNGSLTRIENQTTGAAHTCAAAIGFVTVDVEDATHRVLTTNVLRGYQVVKNHDTGKSFSLPAVALAGTAGNGDRSFAFNGSEYARFPAALRTDFTAPDASGPAAADLVVFTPAFDRQFPPLTDCSVIATNRYGEQFSNSFQFGCFAVLRLEDIDPQLTADNLGSERGSLQLTCTVHGTGQNGVVSGGVHGALVQTDAAGKPAGTLLQRSTADGGAATLRLADPVR